MKRIINTFKYGSTQVKAVLAFTLLAGLGTVGFVVAALLMSQMMFFFAAVICAFITISLMQTFVIKGEEEAKQGANPQMQGLPDAQIDATLNGRIPETSVDMNQAMDMRDANPEDEVASKEKKAKSKKAKKEKTKKEKVKKQKKDKKGGFKKASAEADEYADEMDELLSRIENSLESAGTANIQQMSPEQMDDFEMDNLEVQPEDMEEAMPESKEPEKLVPVQASEEVLATYNKKKIKKTFHKYKVKRDHRMIMIDHSEKLHIHQTPAYMWVADKELHFLLIEKEPRHITIPEFQFREVTYLKKQLVNEDIDYGAFKGSNMLADLFRPYLPDYTHSTVVDDLSAYKNLYGLGNDIFVTNRSAASLFDLLAVEFRVDDKVTTSTKVNVFFKEAYKSNILLRDNVIDANGYADQISNTLNNLAHSTVSYAEFKDTLNLMIKNKLITQEFAMYYMDIRNKL